MALFREPSCQDLLGHVRHHIDEDDGAPLGIPLRDHSAAGHVSDAAVGADDAIFCPKIIGYLYVPMIFRQHMAVIGVHRGQKLVRSAADRSDVALQRQTEELEGLRTPGAGAGRKIGNPADEVSSAQGGLEQRLVLRAAAHVELVTVRAHAGS